MYKIHLPDLVIEKGQAYAARVLGVKPPSIAKAVSAGRQIIVTVHDDGTYTAEELRPFPSQKNVA
jgi:hypothetical protein